MEMSVKEYLDSVANPNTRKSYRIGIQKFCDWYGRSPSEILEIRKDDLTPRDGENIIDHRNSARVFHSFFCHVIDSFDFRRQIIVSPHRHACMH